MSPDEKGEKQTRVEEDTGQAIDALMSGSDVVDLDSAAQTAAEQVAGEITDDASDGAEGQEPYEDPSSTSVSAKIDRVLQVLLLCNLVLITALIMFPSTPAPAAEPESERPAFTGEHLEPPPDPFVQEPRRIADLPTSQLWEHAVHAAGVGDYAKAAILLEQHLKATHPITDVEKRLIYNQLSYYLVKDGRIEEAQQYERKSSQIMTRSYLPEDLLNSAHRAAEQGQLGEMRTSYARFLLQQKQIPPSLRKHIAEAYLKLGDSYRLEAERATDRAERQVLPQPKQDASKGNHK